MREKFPNTELFLSLSKSPYLVQMHGEYGPEITPYLDTFLPVKGCIRSSYTFSLEENLFFFD